MGAVLKLWGAEARKEVAELKGHPRTVMAVVFSPDGTRLVSADRQGMVRMWSFKKE